MSEVFTAQPAQRLVGAPYSLRLKLIWDHCFHSPPFISEGQHKMPTLSGCLLWSAGGGTWAVLGELPMPPTMRKSAGAAQSTL